jgi:hypothetical protein
MHLRKVLAVIGVGVVLFAASDAATYAATGSSLIMGRINQAGSVTTIQNTSTGSALRLITKSTTTPPMVVNGKGKVVNLYADRSATANNATKLGGKTVAQVVSMATPRVSGVVRVAKSGGQFTSVRAALAWITNNGPSHPYVILVAPGTYLEKGAVVVKNYVDIEGSGRDTTTISCACSSAIGPGINGSSATLRADGSGLHSEVRHLTVTNTVANSGTNTSATAVWIHATAAGSFTLRDVAAVASGSHSDFGVYNSSSSPTIIDVTATGSGGALAYGVFNDHASTAMINTVATATGDVARGVYNSASSVTMTDVRAAGTSASGGSYGIGVQNVASTMVMTNGAAIGISSEQSLGVLTDSSTVTMSNVTATGSGGSLADGVLITSGSALIRDSFVTGSNSVALSSGTVRILNTVFNGNTFGVGAAACVGGMTTGLTPYTCL